MGVRPVFKYNCNQMILNYPHTQILLQSKCRNKNHRSTQESKVSLEVEKLWPFRSSSRIEAVSEIRELRGYSIKSKSLKLDP